MDGSGGAKPGAGGRGVVFCVYPAHSMDALPVDERRGQAHCENPHAPIADPLLSTFNPEASGVHNSFCTIAHPLAVQPVSCRSLTFQGSGDSLPMPPLHSLLHSGCLCIWKHRGGRRLERRHCGFSELELNLQTMHKCVGVQVTEQPVKDLGLPFDWHLTGVKPQPQTLENPLAVSQAPAVMSPKFSKL